MCQNRSTFEGFFNIELKLLRKVQDTYTDTHKSLVQVQSRCKIWTLQVGKAYFVLYLSIESILFYSTSQLTGNFH